MNTNDTEATSTLERIPTGNEHLDDILGGGGFPANSINIIMGEPGSGKTVLVERLIFANADNDDRPIVFLTTLSEPLDKVIRYLQEFHFFDMEKMGTAVQYESLGEDLAKDGIAAILPRLKEIIQTQRPKIVVIDSFKAIHDLSPSMPDMRRMLFELAGMLTAYETTAFLLGEYGTEQTSVYPEFAVADGMVELARNKLGTRDERYLGVLKLRGSAYLEGFHSFRITRDGLGVYPRLVSPRVAPAYSNTRERVSTGIPRLDVMLDGGLPRGTSTFLLGPTGAGKTTVGMHFVLEGLRNGERCLYVNFEENPTQLAHQFASFGLSPTDGAAQGLVTQYASPVELQIDSILSSIFETISREGVRRVVVDAVGDLMMAASDTSRLASYLYALAQHFSVNGIASIFLYEVEHVHQSEGRFSALADNIILLGSRMHDRALERTIRVIKVRGSGHDLNEHEFKITKSGIEVV